MNGQTCWAFPVYRVTCERYWPAGRQLQMKQSTYSSDRIGRELGSLVAALGGLDVFVFTGGIGENAAEIRAGACTDAKSVGITSTRRQMPETAFSSAPASPVSVWVVRTDGNLMVVRHTLRSLDR